MGNESAALKGGKAEGSLSEGRKPYVDKKSVTGVLSEFLILRIGEFHVFVLSMSFLGIGVILFFYGLVSEYLLLFYLAYLFLIPGCTLCYLREYYLSRKCKNCGEDFAYVKTRKSEICHDGVEKTTYNYYRCKFCGHEHVEVKKSSTISPSEQV